MRTVYTFLLVNLKKPLWTPFRGDSKNGYSLTSTTPIHLHGVRGFLFSYDAFHHTESGENRPATPRYHQWIVNKQTAKACLRTGSSREFCQQGNEPSELYSVDLNTDLMFPYFMWSWSWNETLFSFSKRFVMQKY
jgi:hypothetical protein